MKKLIFITAMIATFAICTVSCGPNIKKELLAENLFLVSEVNDEGRICGVENADGAVLVPAEYDDIKLEDGYLFAVKGYQKYLYTTDGKLIYDKPSSTIFVYDTYITFYGDDKSALYFKPNKRFVGPYTNIRERGDLFFVDDGQKVEVITPYGETLVSGDSLIYLFSRTDAKYYFIMAQDGAFNAFDSEGNMLTKLNAKRLDKLPKALWTCGSKIKAVSTRNELTAFKK